MARVALVQTTASAVAIQIMMDTNTGSADVVFLHRRLTRLERQNRRARAVAGAALVAAAAMPLLASVTQDLGAAPATDATRSPGTVQARAFELVDGEGKVRARLHMADSGGPDLRMFDGQGRPRLRLAVHKDNSPLLFLIDSEDKNRAAMICDDLNNSHVILSMPGGKPAVHLSVANSGAGSLLFTHREGFMNAGIGLHESGEGWLIQKRGGSSAASENGAGHNGK